MSGNPNGDSKEHMDAMREVQELREQEHDNLCAAWDRANPEADERTKGRAHSHLWEIACNKIT